MFNQFFSNVVKNLNILPNSPVTVVFDPEKNKYKPILVPLQAQRCPLSNFKSPHRSSLGNLFYRQKNRSGRGLWPWRVKKWIFNFNYMKNRVYHLKPLKKLYKGHLNGTYQFRNRNTEKCVSKLWIATKNAFFSQLWNTFFTISVAKSICSV